MLRVIKRPDGKIRPGRESRPGVALITRALPRAWRGIVGILRRYRIHRAASPNVDRARQWHRHRSRWIALAESLAYLGAVIYLLWAAYALAVLAFFRRKMWVENYCDQVGACGNLSGFVGPFLALALATAAFLLWRRWWVKRPIMLKAKSRAQDLVPTAGTIINSVVGRDELCRVIMQGLHDPEMRRPHLLVGGVGTGKTAVLVQLTRMLADRRAVPVPIRLRDVDRRLNFNDAARERFCTEVDPGTMANGQAEKVWRQLRRHGQVVVLADGLEEAFPAGDENEKDRDNLIRQAIRQADEQKLPLVIASRPHHPLEATTAAIMELEPLSEEAALEYVGLDMTVQDEHRIDWIVETASVADAPLYLQMTRQLHKNGLLEHVTDKSPVRLDTREVDCSALRWRLLDAWREALAKGHLRPDLALSTTDRDETIKVVSGLACVGLLKDTLEVKFEDLIGYVGKDETQAGAGSGGPADVNYQPAYPEIWDKVRQHLWPNLSERQDNGPRRYRWLVSLAATRGEQLGLVEAYGNRVRFPHSILQSYFGSSLLKLFLQEDGEDNRLAKALNDPGPGRELLIALVLHSREKRDLWEAAEGDRASASVTAGTEAGTQGGAMNDTSKPRTATLREMLLTAAGDHVDAKAFDIYAAALEIDSMQDESNQGLIAKNLSKRWKDVRTGDRRTLEEAKLGVVRRFGDAAREVARRKGAAAYEEFFAIGQLEESYPVRLAVAQEIGSGGNAAFKALEEILHEKTLRTYMKGKQHENRRNGTEEMPGPGNQPVGNTNAQAAENNDAAPEPGEREDLVRGNSGRSGTSGSSGNSSQRPEIWRGLVLRAWLAPMLAGSVKAKYREPARKYLEDWLRQLKPERSRRGRAKLPISLEIALSQGFKAAANRRKRNPYTSEEARGYLIEHAEEMLKYSRFWFTQLTLIHALCLWALPDAPGAVKSAGNRATQNGEVKTKGADNGGEQLKRRRATRPAETVARWLSIAGSKCDPGDLHPDDRLTRGQRIHPFVAEAGDLAVLALESGHPERFIWIDESGIISKVGSRAATPTEYRRHNLWVPPSAGWSALDRGAQQLVADVLVLLNLTEQTGSANSPDELPEELERRLESANRSLLPPCITRDRKPLEPARTIGRAESGERSCPNSCPFDLCPYPPSGAQPRAELTEAFCRRQQALLSRGFPWLRRKTAPWHGMTRKALRSFWAEMADRTRPPKPDD